MISVVIPTYNRTDLLFKALEVPLYDDRVNEIVISDDHSDQSIFSKVAAFCEDKDKIVLIRNTKNVDCFKNKKIAVENANNEYVIILDSDNQISTEYIDAIYSQRWQSNRILQPSFAKPAFDFRAYNSLNVTKENVSHYIDKPMFEVMLNAMNYFVNRGEYLRVWDDSVNPVTSDSIWVNYNWLKAGNEIYITPGMHYNHLIHEGSHYKKNNRRTPNGFHESIINKLKELK